MSPEEKAPSAPKSRITLPHGVNLWWNVKKRLWRVGWRDDAGRQQFEHFRLKAAAEERAREVAELVLARGREALRATGFADARHWGRVKAALGAATLDQLLSVWERHKHEVIGRPPIPIGEALTRYYRIRLKSGDWGSDTARHVRLHLSRLCEEFGGVEAESPEGEVIWDGGDDIGTVTKEGIVEWLEELSEANKSCWPHQKDAAAFFSRALKEDWVLKDPMDGIPRPKKEDEDISVISVADAKKLFDANRDQPVVVRLALEAFGGLRASFAQRLVFEEVKWDENALLLPGKKHKSGRRHYLDGLPENLWDWLKPWRNRPEAWEWNSSQLMHAKSAAIQRAFGKPLPKNILRHSFCSYHVALHKDAAKTAVLLQHTNPTMLYKHYKGCASAADAAHYFGIRP